MKNLEEGMAFPAFAAAKAVQKHKTAGCRAFGMCRMK
jgi:hypothetical protein